MSVKFAGRCGVVIGLLVVTCGVVQSGRAQVTGALPKETAYPPKTFYLVNATQQADANEILTVLRNILPPATRILMAGSQNAIVVSAPPDVYAEVEKLLGDLDRPKKSYRLSYTVGEEDGGKRVGTQHYQMVLVPGQRTTMKQGSRVPVVTGSYTVSGTSSTQTQVTYLDVGMNFDATVEESGGGVRLKTKVEHSSLAPETSGVGVQDPVVRQTMVEGVVMLSPGKPLVLGSLDVQGSTRHLDIEVVMEVVR